MSHFRISKRRGFTLVELLVVIGIIALLISILLPVLSKARERANRTKCAANLRALGQAFQIYAHENRGNYPRTRYAAPFANLSNFYISPNANYLFDAAPPPNPESPSPNDAAAAMFLLIRYGLALPSSFICPSTNQVTDNLAFRPGRLRANFSSPNNLSYGVAMPYPHQTAVNMGYRYGLKAPSTFALMADRNQCRNRDAAPSDPNAPPSKMKEMNSMNHGSDGQNVLFNDSHVEWTTSPFVGARKNNIYMLGRPDQVNFLRQSTVNFPPQFDQDTMIVPTFNQDGSLFY